MRDDELSDEYIRLEILKMAEHRIDTRVHAAIVSKRSIDLNINDYFDSVKIFTDYIKFGIIPKKGGSKMKCVGIYDPEKVAAREEFYLKLETTKTSNFPCVRAVYADGTYVPHGQIVVITPNKLIKTTQLNPDLGFELEPDKSIASW